MANRKDSKGRVLRTGESQRKDGIYMYRYTDFNKRRVCIYAPTLKELREKEKEIQELINHGVNYAEGLITVTQLMERYRDIKQGVSNRTKLLYNSTINLLKKDKFGSMIIKNVKKSDVQQWVIRLYKSGKKYNTVKTTYSLVKAAFNIAYEEQIIQRNPCIFRLSMIIENNSKQRTGITNEEQQRLLKFLQNDTIYHRYYDIINILLETGLRISELCGLTFNDIDLKNRKIKVNHQLVLNKSEYEINKPKSKSGIRDIPMTDSAYQSFKNVIKKRKQPKIEMMIQGYTGFLFITKVGTPMIGNYIQRGLTSAVNKYNKSHPDTPLPHITPHMLRHTFCTNLATKGMNVKNLQYLMGHADVSVTLEVYTHTSYDMAEQQMKNIL